MRRMERQQDIKYSRTRTFCVHMMRIEIIEKILRKQSEKMWKKINELFIFSININSFVVAAVNGKDSVAL